MTFKKHRTVSSYNETDLLKRKMKKSEILILQILGLLVEGSGFEEVIYQSGICTSGSLSGALAGSHYNRAWRIHQTMCEAMERLLLKRFLHEIKPDVSDELKHAAAENSNHVSFDSIPLCRSLHAEFHQFRKRVKSKAFLSTTSFPGLLALRRAANRLKKAAPRKARSPGNEVVLSHYFLILLSTLCLMLYLFSYQVVTSEKQLSFG